jgi:hypothetical protein
LRQRFWVTMSPVSNMAAVRALEDHYINDFDVCEPAPVLLSP